MNLLADIKSQRLLVAKGFLFLFLGLFASGLILLEHPNLRTLALLVITIWAFCRFYYFLFYVLENYIGRNQKYAGVLDAMAYLIRLKNSASSQKPPPPEI
jgi:hypothetical protein